MVPVDVMLFELGYNTSGFAHHRLEDVLPILAEIGYRSIALTLDHQALNPYDDDRAEQIRRIRALLRHHDLCCVIETGARFLLDPMHKHQPSLLSVNEAGRARRWDFLRRSVEIAVELEAEAVSFWSGAQDPTISARDAWGLLVDACDRLLTHAVRYDLRLAIEPEPGMYLERMDQFSHLVQELNHPRFGLTLDVGHVHCLQDGAPADRIREFSEQLYNVHIEDMRTGRHEHLMFGEGEMAFAPIVAALDEVGYTGTVNVELSRHSHDAVNAAKQAFAFLTKLLK